jgi:coenzyme F420-reducing hydrogenase delta subunit
LDEKRLKMDYCTAAEGQKFQIVATAFDKTIRELGPSPLRPKTSTPKKKAKA